MYPAQDAMVLLRPLCQIFAQTFVQVLLYAAQKQKDSVINPKDNVINSNNRVINPKGSVINPKITSLT
jgi:hypothetical protein